MKFFEKPQDIPIFNFYESFKDLSLLLTEPKELTDLDKALLQVKQMEFQDWLNFKIAETETKDFYQKHNRLLKDRYTMAICETWLKVFKGFDFDFTIEKVFKPEQVEKLKAQFKALGFPYLLTSNHMIKYLEGKKAGLTNSIQLHESRLKTTEKDFDYMDMVILANKQLGYKIDPMRTSLYEWGAIVNNVKKISNGGRN